MVTIFPPLHRNDKIYLQLAAVILNLSPLLWKMKWNNNTVILSLCLNNILTAGNNTFFIPHLPLLPLTVKPELLPERLRPVSTIYYIPLTELTAYVDVVKCFLFYLSNELCVCVHEKNLCIFFIVRFDWFDFIVMKEQERAEGSPDLVLFKLPPLPANSHCLTAAIGLLKIMAVAGRDLRKY